MACKAGEESGLPPAGDENAAGRKINRKVACSLMGEQYQSAAQGTEQEGAAPCLAACGALTSTA